MLRLLDERDAETRRGLLKYALRGVAFSENDFYRARRRHVRDDARVNGRRYLVQTFEVGRVGHRYVQTPPLAPQGHEHMPQHQLDGNLAEERVVNRRVADGRQEVNVRQTVAAGGREGGGETPRGGAA